MRRVLLTLAVALPVGLLGAPLVLPHSFVNGDMADASQVNANFTAVKTAVDAQDVKLVQLVPAGVILPFGGTTAPTGYLLCNGQAVSRTGNAALFAAIGTSFGSGDGSTTFNVPDLRGRFLRGVDSVNGAGGNDPDDAARTAMTTGGNTGNAVGSVQGHQYGSHDHGGGNHSHGFWNNGSASMYVAGTAGDARFRPLTVENNTNYNNPGLGINYSGNVIAANGGNETRPVNASVNYIIKL